MSEQILKPEQAKSIYSALCAANNIGVRHFRIDFDRANLSEGVAEHITFGFYDTSTAPNVGVALIVNGETVRQESYADQNHFAAAYGLEN